MFDATNEKIIVVPRYDVPALWDTKNRRAKLQAQGIDPDQMVRVRMIDEVTGEIIEFLPYNYAEYQRMQESAVAH